MEIYPFQGLILESSEFQLRIVNNANLPWNIYQGEQLARFIPGKTYRGNTKRKLTAFEPYVKFALEEF